MTDKGIFNKVMKKAKQNGFDFKDGGICWLQDKEPILKGWEYLKYKNLVMVGVDSTTHTFIGLNDIIFSHEFAKAFWEKNYSCVKCKSNNLTVRETYVDLNTEVCKCNDCGFIEGYWSEDWKFHLWKMVLEKEPLKYLEGFL